MEFLGQDYLEKRIKDNQKFLLKLLNFHIGKYYPLRKWLGISFRGKIDDISHLSFGYNTKYIQKEGQWYKQQTREYQQPDLGYKLNLVLDRIPQLALLPALLQPAYRLASVLLFSLTTTTYQPTIKDTWLNAAQPTTNYGSDTNLALIYYPPYYQYRPILHFDISDIPSGATFSQGDFSGYYLHDPEGWMDEEDVKVYMARLTRTNWTESGATWNTYDGVNSWTTAGGDFTTTNQVSITFTNETGWETWSASSLIYDCYNLLNKQVHLILYQTGGDCYARGIYSREYTTNTSLRPKLTVTYTVTLTTVALQSTFFIVSSPTLVSPSDTTSGTSPVTFIWKIPSDVNNRPVHAHIQIDKTSDDFGDLEADLYSHKDAGFEYYNGTDWVAYPITGVTSDYYGNQARITLTLTTGWKYWRVRGGVALS